MSNFEILEISSSAVVVNLFAILIESADKLQLEMKLKICI